MEENYWRFFSCLACFFSLADLAGFFLVSFLASCDLDINILPADDFGAGDRDRTGDVQLGKLAFYR